MREEEHPSRELEPAFVLSLTSTLHAPPSQEIQQGTSPWRSVRDTRQRSLEIASRHETQTPSGAHSLGLLREDEHPPRELEPAFVFFLTSTLHAPPLLQEINRLRALGDRFEARDTDRVLTLSDPCKRKSTPPANSNLLSCLLRVVHPGRSSTCHAISGRGGDI